MRNGFVREILGGSLEFFDSIMIILDESADKRFEEGVMHGRSITGPAISKLLMAVWLLLAPASLAWAQSAPDFALKDVVRGQEYTLRQFRGQVVVLNFFSYLCKPCREEMPALNQLDQEFKGLVQVLGMGIASTPEELRSLTQQLGLNYPVLLGNEAVSAAYGKVEFVPTTFIIDRQGNIAQKIPEARSKADFIKLIKPLL
jgi:peroxiredoxin